MNARLIIVNNINSMSRILRQYIRNQQYNCELVINLIVYCRYVTICRPAIFTDGKPKTEWTVRVINSIWSIAALFRVSLGSLEWKNWTAGSSLSTSLAFNQHALHHAILTGCIFHLENSLHDSWSIIMVSTFSPSLTDSRFIRSLGQWTCKNCIISWQKTRPRNVRKITTNTTNFTFYYLLIFLYDTKKLSSLIFQTFAHVSFATN